MSDGDPSYEELQARLTHAEMLLAALRRGEVDAVISQSSILLVSVQEAEAALREGEARYRSLFEHSVDAILLITADGRILMANPAASRLFGYTAAELAQIREQALIDQTDPKALGALAALASAGRFQGEIRYLRKDKSTFIGETSAAIFGEQDGEKKTTVIIRDISERRRAEQRLRVSEERFRRHFELGLIGMATTSPTKGILEGNDELCRILGYERKELLQKTWAEMTHPDDFAADVAQFNRVMAGEIDGYTMDKRWVRKDGQIIDTITAAKCLRRADGSVDYFVGLVQDITERKRDEEKLRRNEAFLAEGQKISRTGSWAVKFPSEEVLWSQEMYRIYGLDPAGTKLSQQSVFGLIHPEDRSSVQAAFDRAVRDKSDCALEHRAIMTDGSVKHLQTLGRPVLNESGELIEYIGTVMDVTEPKRNEAAMQKLQTEVVHAARMAMMGELAASIAHEINQPLGALVNNGNVAMRLAKAAETTSDRLLEVLSDIVSDADRASAIIARIRSVMRKTDREKTSLQLKDLVLDILRFAQRELTAHRIEVRLEFSEDLPSVSGDRVQLQEMFVNLVMNGIDAMSAVEGERRILTIRGKREELDGKPAVLIAVHDLGSGFKPEDNDRLFEAFYTTKPDGLGMGLRISRSIVESHGGRLWGSSNEGQGATFYCALPAE